LRENVPFGVHVHGSPLWFTKPDRILPHRRSRAYDQLVDEVPGHGEFTEPTGITRRRRVRGEIGELLRRRALQRAAFVTTGSERVARELVWLYDADPHLARPGVSESWIDGASETEVVSLGPWDHTVLSVSRLDPRKRIDLLVRTVARLRTHHGQDAGLVVCGTGDEEDRLRSLVADHDVTDAVRFEGFVPDEELPTYYRSADVFACPAWMSYGLSPLEAYALSTPVVLSTDTYAKEVIGDRPGVRVAEPTVGAWTSALTSQFDTDSRPEPSTVPTWTTYSDRRAALVDRHTLR
jgi:glycosyltransferase involved in cell wall biosynthesis